MHRSGRLRRQKEPIPEGPRLTASAPHDLKSHSEYANNQAQDTNLYANAQPSWTLSDKLPTLCETLRASWSNNLDKLRRNHIRKLHFEPPAWHSEFSSDQC